MIEAPVSICCELPGDFANAFSPRSRRLKQLCAPLSAAEQRGRAPIRGQAERAFPGLRLTAGLRLFL